MPQRGGFLIRFDEQQRTLLLDAVVDIEEGFSDALSAADWPLRQWEVCGLMFEADIVTHWGLARRGRRVATGKVRVEFAQVTSTRVPLKEIEERLAPGLRSNVGRARSGVGGRLPPATWARFKEVLRSVNRESFSQLERLERLRDRSDSPIDLPGAGIVAQERDATGVMLDVLDSSGRLRGKTLSSWAPPGGTPLRSFLDGLDGVRMIEGQAIARDAAVFAGSTEDRQTVVGAVFRVGDRTLEVFNVDRTPIEASLGVDLVYYHEEFDAWTLVQYKMMEHHPRTPAFRPNEQFDADIKRMAQFRAQFPDKWDVADGRTRYRLCGDGFYFKFCSRIQLEVLSPALLPGMYLPRQYIDALLDPGILDPSQGRVITFENTRRHVTNTLFADLVRDAWIGTRGVSSQEISKIVNTGLKAGRSLVLGRGRPAGVDADLEATTALLGL